MFTLHSVRLLTFVVIFSCLNVLTGNSQAQTNIPENWPAMEIESKWEIDAKKFDDLYRAFSDGSELYGYTMNVRWSGISRKFIDVYYDTASDTLSQDLHSLRHRTRYRSRPLAPNNAEGSLNTANWQEDWQRVQYKSKPCSIGAIWFRIEAGICRIKDSDGGRLCAADRQLSINSVISGHLPSHAGIALLAKNHPNLVLTDLQPLLHVFDYRYRVLFEKDGNAEYELSLDRVTTTDLLAGGTKKSFEAELEIVSSERTLDHVNNLIQLAEKIQIDFGLTPSILSKGGIPVPACL